MTKSSSVTTVTAILLALGLTATRPGPAEAQNRVDFETRAGIGLPAFDLADRADPGLAVGLDLGYRVSERFVLLVGGDVEFLEGASGAGTAPTLPGLTAWHYAVGLEANLLDPHTTYWRLSTGAGVGGSAYDAEGGDSRTALSLYGSLELGYEISPEADLFVGLRSWVGFAGEKTDPIQAPTVMEDPPADPLFGVESTAWSFPVTAGLRFHF